MDELQITETEQRYFSDLFVCCDNDNTGLAPVNKAVELFRSGNIPNDVLTQVIIIFLSFSCMWGRRNLT